MHIFLSTLLSLCPVLLFQVQNHLFLIAHADIEVPIPCIVLSEKVHLTILFLIHQNPDISFLIHPLCYLYLYIQCLIRWHLYFLYIHSLIRQHLYFLHIQYLIRQHLYFLHFYFRYRLQIQIYQSAIKDALLLSVSLSDAPTSRNIAAFHCLPYPCLLLFFYGLLSDFLRFPDTTAQRILKSQAYQTVHQYQAMIFF